MEQKLRVDPIVGNIGLVISKALTNKEITHVFGAVNETAVVIGVDFESLTRELLFNVDLTGYNVNIKDGHLFVFRDKEETKEEVDKVNLMIAQNLARFGINAKAYMTTDNVTVLVVNLNDIALKVLENTLEIAKGKLGNKLRNVRIKYGNDDKWGYMVVYKRGEKVKDVVKRDDLSDLTV